MASAATKRRCLVKFHHVLGLKSILPFQITTFILPMRDPGKIPDLYGDLKVLYGGSSQRDLIVLSALLKKRATTSPGLAP